MNFLVKMWFGIAIIFILATLMQGCAALPMNWQPTDPGSRAAEGAWEVIDAVDTAQTMHFVKGNKCHESDPVAKVLYGGGNPPPARVLLINGALMPVHSYVSRWFDDHVTASEAADDGDVGLWYTGRIAWHVLSLGYSTQAVLSTRANGCM